MMMRRMALAVALGVLAMLPAAAQDKEVQLKISLWIPPAHPLVPATKAWADFRADPEWQKVSKESEANGKLVNHVDSVFAQATDYSPMK